MLLQSIYKPTTHDTENLERIYCPYNLFFLKDVRALLLLVKIGYTLPVIVLFTVYFNPFEQNKVEFIIHSRMYIDWGSEKAREGEGREEKRGGVGVLIHKYHTKIYMHSRTSRVYNTNILSTQNWTPLKFVTKGNGGGGSRRRSLLSNINIFFIYHTDDGFAQDREIDRETESL